LSQCTVERLGFQIIIEGPTEEASSRAPKSSGAGALITRGPESEDGVWKLYLEDVGARTGNMITS